jgi:U3 small nucleolar RNA-associated protein 25
LLIRSRDPERDEEHVTDRDDSGEDLQSEAFSTDRDSTEEPVVRPYTALLQSLSVNSKPPAKRRKLDAPQGTDVASRTYEDITIDTMNDMDQVEEAEEGPELSVHGLLGEDEGDAEEASDPFEAHFADSNDNDLSRRLSAIQKDQWTTQKVVLSKLGKALFSVPEAVRSADISLPVAISGPGGLKLKQKLAGSVTRQTPIFDTLEKSLAPCIFHYHDVFFCERTPSNSESIRRLACLHAVNHVFM